MTFHKYRKGFFLLAVPALLLSVLMLIDAGETTAQEDVEQATEEIALEVTEEITEEITETEEVMEGPLPGKPIYEKNCLVCHGTLGDGIGAVCSNTVVEKSGRSITTFPRDFTLGVFKFRTTSTGCLPDDTDLLATINNGIPKAFMPSYDDLSGKEKNELIEYIQSFSARWFEEDPCEQIAIAKPHYVGSPESVERGKQVYKEMKCWECHGETGKGDGTKSAELKDDWGHKIVPFDFTSGDLKRGTSPEAIYITFSSGLDGSGMPSYEDTLKEEDRWHIVSYTLKLMGKE